MKARWYDPAIGRFISPDTIVPNPTNPQSFNRYSYVDNNPVNFSDPTGHIKCSKLGTELCSADGENYFGERVSVEGYGLFDESHIMRGFNAAQTIMNHLYELSGEGGGTFALNSYTTGHDTFSATYQVNGNVSEGEHVGIALGIYQDFERGYEAFQLRGKAGIEGIGGAFAPEDFPSDYLGFWAYVNGYSLEDIPQILENLGNVEHYEGPLEPILGDRAGSLVFGIDAESGYISIPRNFSFTPMAPIVSNTSITWLNVSWPQGLQIAPVMSSETTWWRVD